MTIWLFYLEILVYETEILAVCLQVLYMYLVTLSNISLQICLFDEISNYISQHYFDKLACE